MIGDAHLPTLWNPQEFFFHLAVWAGVPAIVMAAAAGLLGLYQSVRSWIDLGKSTIEAAGVARGKARAWTTSQQQAMIRFLILSVLVAAFSYMLAVIIDAEVRMLVANPNAVISMKDVVDHTGVMAWPIAAVWSVAGEVVGISVLGIAYIADLEGVATFVTALGSVVWIAAWLVGLLTILEAAGGFWLNLVRAQGAPPLQYVTTIAVTGILGLALARLLPRLENASANAFAPTGRT
jgi:hypothetical protein